MPSISVLGKSVEETGIELRVIDKQEQAIKESLGREQESALWQELELEYDSDVEESDAVESGIKLCCQSLEQFKHRCKSMVEERKSKYSPRHFKQDLEEFLAEVEKDLQQHFDHVCSFRKLNTITHNYIEDATARITTLHTTASDLCHKDATASNETIEELRHGATLKQPKLGDIKDTIGIPNVELNRSLKKFMIRSFPKRVKRSRRSSDSAQEDEEQVPMEYDMPYKRWNEELERTLKELNNQLEKSCREYFPGIKGRTIRYFYQQVYSRKKVGKKYENFKGKYSTKLKQVRKEHAKSIERLQGLKAARSQCEELEQHFDKLRTHIRNIHEEFERYSVQPAT